MNNAVAIICDFDGTLAVRDIGHHFFGTYIKDTARWRELLGRWKMGLISSRECLEREVSWLEADQAELDSFIDREKLDPFIKDFIDFCTRQKYEFLILSDGMDYYIDALLMKFGLGYLDFKANHLVLEGGRIAGVEFPYHNLLDCTMCGNCKKFHVDALREEGFYTVYIGNGYSDRCPCEHTDLVFAKGDLLDHCRQKGIDCIPFDNFRDVERELTSRLLMSE
ncbi:MAG: MtnX-like HAD-IB family phosphatase [Candidatus Krumholzibacteriota bacterium]|nr:MtnX-like HAD-IB family phosphatase [Candidatus Krumholzibacteriota bacterium]